MNPKDKAKLDLSAYDVVITTYGVLSSEWSQLTGKKKTPLFDYEWHRIILDEAHYIKGRTINLAKACFELKGNNRWCLTGTPIQNRMEELFSLIHFIRLPPWDDFSWWNKYIIQTQKTEPYLVNQIVQTILRPVLLRRCKDSKDSQGNPIIDLPKKNYAIKWVKLTDAELEIYKTVEKRNIEEFKNLDNAGMMLSKYFHIFQLISKLRQLCDHPFMLQSYSDLKVEKDEDFERTLRKFYDKRNNFTSADMCKQFVFFYKKKQMLHMDAHLEVIGNIEGNKRQKEQQLRMGIPEKPKESFFIEVVKDLQAGNYQECKVCFGDLEDSIITSCLHVFCRLCIVRSQQTTSFCPICRRYITKDDYMTVPKQSRFINDLKSYKRSAKMQAIMDKLQEIFARDEKVVIFTIFLGMMDLLEYEFKEQNYNYLRFDGSTSQKHREKYIHQFKTDPEYKIIMISLAAGGCGLNLTEANNVFIVDPWWNPAVEDQAIERVHRIGQKKEVFVTRFLCEQTIEQRMNDIQIQKKDMFDNLMTTENKQMNENDQKTNQIEMFRHLLSKY